MKLILNLTLATSWVALSVTAFAQTPVLLRTFNNPTPAAAYYFGSALAALGSDRVLLGAQYDSTTATNAGAVYLFHTNETLLTTFTNPYPSSGFGGAITTLGSDRVVIGSSWGFALGPTTGSVHLFTTNGALVKTISGWASPVVACGNDKLLIGPDLYDTNGTLLTTFENPETNQTTALGYSVAAFGIDRVLISANDITYSAGIVYLFNTNGTLLTTITNPAPGAEAYFGLSVAAVGTDRILISAYGDDALGSEAGSVYVFNTNGTLLNTITYPTPAYGVAFGAQMVVLGEDRLVISAPRDSTTSFEAGAAYVYHINGTLLATINNPTPAIYDYFGWSMASFGSEGVIINAPLDDAGAPDAGSVYLFSVTSSPIPPGDTSPPVISNVRSSIVNAKKGTFAISWTTDEPATSVIILNGTIYSDSHQVTSHSRTFRGRKNTRYTYSVRSTDAAGNQITAGSFTHQN